MATKEELQSVARSWEESYRKTVAKNPERRPRFPRSDGTPVAPLYTPLDVDSDRYLEEVGFPGRYPFTRGVQTTMYRGRLWTMRQYAGFGSAEESNRRYKYLLEQGQTGLSVAFDLPTQMGYDSDHPKASGEVGKVGVAVSSIEDMRALFDGIPLDKVSTSMTINSTAAVLLCLYMAVAEEQGVPRTELRGTIQNDVLKEYIARGTYIYPPTPSLRIITDIFAFCRDELPNWNTISISGYHIREAGSDAVQEVAFTLANAITYVQAAVDRGLDVDEFAGRLAFFFGVHNNLLEEVSKFRAARRCWAKIMRERFHAKQDRSCMLRFHSQTAGCTLTAQQPDNNIVRVTLQALSAVLGGTQSLHTNSRDEALALPTEQSVRIALRTQQIIGYESGVADFVDPLAGSYAVEAMTDAIEKRVWQYLETIAAMGGMVKAIENGYAKKEIADTSYAYQLAVETGDEVVVGVNRFRMDESPVGDILTVDPHVEARQCERLAALRARRDEAEVRATLSALRDAARGTENVVPLIFAAVRANATLGEVSDTLRDVYGLYQETLVV